MTTAAFHGLIILYWRLLSDAFGELIAFQRALKDLVAPRFKHLEMFSQGLKGAVEQIMSLPRCWQLASLVAWAVWKEL